MVGPLIDIGDVVLVAIVTGAVGIVGHLATRQSSKEQTTITVMQAQISQLWERVQGQDQRIQAQEKRIDELIQERARERARSWAALEYARTLIAFAEGLRRIIGESAPEIPPHPEELDADL